MGIEFKDTMGGFLTEKLVSKMKEERKKELYEEDKGDGEEPDPYLTLGFGIQAYFKMSIILLGIFFLLACLSGPIMLIYNKYDGLNSTLPNHYMTQVSLGNLGFSTPACRFYYANLERPISFGYLRPSLIILDVEQVV